MVTQSPYKPSTVEWMMKKSAHILRFFFFVPQLWGEKGWMEGVKEKICFLSFLLSIPFFFVEAKMGNLPPLSSFRNAQAEMAHWKHPLKQRVHHGITFSASISTFVLLFFVMMLEECVKNGSLMYPKMFRFSFPISMINFSSPLSISFNRSPFYSYLFHQSNVLQKVEGFLFSLRQVYAKMMR